MVNSLLVKRLFQPVDLASLAVFRFALGVLMLAEVGRYVAYGWIARYYLQPTYHFTYPGFSWVQPWPGNGMYWHFGLLAVAAALMAVGLFYRYAAAAFALGISYVFLLDETQYLNHLYLICLLSFLMVFIPGGRLWALDARWGLAPRAQTAPRWTLLLIQGQLALVYFFGGLAKLEPDWLSGAPGASFLAGWDVTRPLAGHGWFAQLFALSGALFDLLIVPLLLWKKTRLLATLAAVGFHLTNMHMFQIGIFPWLMLAVTPLFYPPSWPRWVIAQAKRLWFGHPVPSPDVPASRPPGPRFQRAITAALLLWFTVQALVPLRHWLYPGDANWTEQGHNFSWHMKLRNKNGDLRLFAVDGGSGQGVELELERHLTRRQVQKMSTRPHMIVQFARHLGEKMTRDLGRPIQIRAYSSVALNGRPYAFMIDPTVDLMTAPPEKYLMPRADAPPAFSLADED